MFEILCYYPAEEPLIFPIIISPNASLLTLEYKILRTLRGDYEVEIEIMQNYMANIPVKPCEDQRVRALVWLQGQRDNTELDSESGSEVQVKDLFPGGPPEDSLHILVADSGVLESLDTVGDANASYQNLIQNDLETVFDRLSSCPSPNNLVTGTQAMYDFLNAEPRNICFNHIPVAMFNPALATLQRCLENLENIEPSSSHLDTAITFVPTAQVLHDDYKRDLQAAYFVECLLGSHKQLRENIVWAGNIKPDAVSWYEGKEGDEDDEDDEIETMIARYHKECGTSDAGQNGAFPVVLLEIKNTLAVGGGAITKSILDYIKIISSQKLEDYRGTCHFPVVLLGMFGSRLQISAAVCAGAVYVSHLYSQDLSSGLHGSENEIQLARVLTALSQCRAELDTYYAKITESGQFDLSSLFPSPISASGMALPALTYRRFMDKATGRATNSIPYLGDIAAALFFATLDATGEEVVVKFTSSYNKEVHVLLADAGLAPRLYCCERIVGGLYMVVMERLRARSLTQLIQARTKHGAVIMEQINRAVDLVHDRGLVLGDMRCANILCARSEEYGEKAYFIDFDWVGKDGEGRYPATLNTENPFEETVRPFGFMRKAHDLWQVARLASSLATCRGAGVDKRKKAIR